MKLGGSGCPSQAVLLRSPPADPQAMGIQHPESSAGSCTPQAAPPAAPGASLLLRSCQDKLLVHTVLLLS